jgi:invasion protein IalB
MKNKIVTLLALAGILLASAASFAAADNKAPAAPAPNVTSADYEDWRLECVTPKDAKAGQKNCHIFQKIADKDSKKVLIAAVVTNVKTQKGETVSVMSFAAPLGVHLTQGLAFRINEDKQVTIPYQVCSQSSCSADVKLTGDQLTNMKTGKTLRAAYQLVGDKPKTFGFSLKGFGKALDALPR